MYLCFPNCNLSEYNLRHTGNRGIEAIHGMFRGGTSSLPITSANLSFREFLVKMNAAQQIQRSEHSLKRIEGSTIMASKKKRRTFAAKSNESCTESQSEYILPSSYDAFIAELEEACKLGDADSKTLVEELAPHMVTIIINRRQAMGKSRCSP